MAIGDYWYYGAAGLVEPKTVDLRLRALARARGSKKVGWQDYKALRDGAFQVPEDLKLADGGRGRPLTRREVRDRLKRTKGELTNCVHCHTGSRWWASSHVCACGKNPNG